MRSDKGLWAVGLLALGCFVGACAQPSEDPEGTDPVPSLDAASCVCQAGEENPCSCGDGTVGTMTCNADCAAWSVCACEGKTGGGGSGGSGVDSGTGGDAGGVTGGSGGVAQDGGSGGTGGSSGSCGGAADTCPGEEIVLTAAGAERTGSASGSTLFLCADYEGTCGLTNASKDAVYSVTPDVDGTLIANLTGSSYDAVLYARSTCADVGTQMACDEAEANGGEVITMSVVAGSTYYLFVDGYGGANGPYVLNVKVSPPECGNGLVEDGEDCDDDNTLSGDGCSDVCEVEPAPAMDTCPGMTLPLVGSGNQSRLGSMSGSTANLASDYAGSCGSSGTSPDAVIAVTPDTAGKMIVTLGTTAWDSVLYVRTNCTTTSSQVDCVDDEGSGTPEQLILNVSAGTTYYIFVDGYSGKNGPFQLNVEVKPPFCGNGDVEGNEACDDGNTENGDGCSATCTIESNPVVDKCPGKVITLAGSGTDNRTGSATGSTLYLSSDYAGSCGSSGGAKDAVYAVTADVGGMMTIDLGGSTATNFDAVLYVRTTCTDDTSQVACNDAIGKGTDSVTFNATPNTTYYVFVDGYSTNSGSYTVNVKLEPAFCGNGKIEGAEECDDSNTAPGDGCHNCLVEPKGPADTCPGQTLALVQTGNQYVATHTGDTSAMTAVYAGTCGTTSGSKDEVFKFNAPVNGKVKVTIPETGTSFNTVLYVREGACNGVGSKQVGCDNQTGNGTDTINFLAAANTDYWIFVDGYSGASGTYRLEVSVTPSCGDGTLDAYEACDDGNVAGSDGCSASCQLEPSCGPLSEDEPNNSDASPKVIPAACGSFQIAGASLPVGDGDHFRVTVTKDAVIQAWTFVGQPGNCPSGNDTVLSLWRAPMPTNKPNALGCNPIDGYVACNDNASGSLCSALTHAVTAQDAGDMVIKVHNYETSSAIDDYSLLVIIK